MPEADSLTPGKAKLHELERIVQTECPISIDIQFKAKVNKSVDVVKRISNGEAAVYGVNTGFGKLASVRIPSKDTATLQRNLILSHCCGVGPSLPKHVVRLIVALKVLSLGVGASGVRWEVIEQLQSMINRGVIPVIPSQGSVGASGDLAPLAHMSAVLIGEGQAEVDGKVLPGKAALKSVGLEPIVLGPKEGLGLINGTQVSTAMAITGLFDAWRLAKTSLLTSSLSTDALMGSSAPLRPELHQLRGHKGQIDAAHTMYTLIHDSQICASHHTDDDRVQDPYSVRCQPQVVGAAMDLLRDQARMLEVEANAVTDNPLIIESTDDIVSGGNFHAEPVAFAADIIAIAVAEIGAIAQRRIALMVDPAQSYGLPAFLSPQPGLNSGFMIAEVTSAALMSENKFLANPCSTDSTPTSANQEDHVSMAAHGALRLKAMNQNLSNILAIELLCGAQGVEFRRPLITSKPLQSALGRLRSAVEPLGDDRELAPDIAVTSTLIDSGAMIENIKELTNLHLRVVH